MDPKLDIVVIMLWLFLWHSLIQLSKVYKTFSDYVDNFNSVCHVPEHYTFKWKSCQHDINTRVVLQPQAKVIQASKILRKTKYIHFVQTLFDMTTV